MRKHTALSLIVFGALGSGMPPGHSQQAARDVTIDVGECIELDSDLERYDCYERLTEAALSESEDVSKSAAHASAVAESDRTENAEPEEIRSTIVALEERRPNEHVITLKNGQTWRQTLIERYPLRVGEEVRIYPSRWGDSHRLSAPDRNGFIQVERVR